MAKLRPKRLSEVAHIDIDILNQCLINIDSATSCAAPAAFAICAAGRTVSVACLAALAACLRGARPCGCCTKLEGDVPSHLHQALQEVTPRCRPILIRIDWLLRSRVESSELSRETQLAKLVVAFTAVELHPGGTGARRHLGACGNVASIRSAALLYCKKTPYCIQSCTVQLGQKLNVTQAEWLSDPRPCHGNPLSRAKN
eukprot:6482962-Amphidinium_carterae.1